MRLERVDCGEPESPRRRNFDARFHDEEIDEQKLDDADYCRSYLG